MVQTQYSEGGPTAEKEILEYMASCGLEASSIEDAISKHGKDALDKIRAASYNNPDKFDPDIVETIVGSFEVAPYDCFSIVHNIAANCPERTAEMLSIYLVYFGKYPKDAIEELYYLCANNKEILNKDLLDAMLRNASADRFRVIYTLRMVLVKRPELITRGMVEFVRDNVDAGANQAFYFLRDIATNYKDHASICVQALFQCVLTFHSNAYKKDFLSDIISIAHTSHIRTEFAEALKRPVEGGNPAARELMALIFREKNHRKQVLLLQEMERALDWDRLWDFFVFLLENPLSKKDMSTDVAERFLDGAYRLSYLLNGHDYRELLYDKMDLSKAVPVKFEGPLAFLDRDGVPEMRGKVDLFAKELGEKVELRTVTEFLERGKAMGAEAAAIEERISKETDTGKKDKMAKRLEHLRKRMSHIDDVPERALNAVRSDVERELRAHLVQLVDLLVTKVRREAVRKASMRILGYESDLWDTDECVYPALFLAEKLPYGNTRRYLTKLIEDRINKHEHDWLWTEPAVLRWMEVVKGSQPKADLARWRHPFSKKYVYKRRMTDEEKESRIATELSEVRVRMRNLMIEVDDGDGHPELVAKLEKGKATDLIAINELKSDLERIRRFMVAPVTDFEGDITFEVETDPFQYLFMGEYGFASCLSMQGVYFWSAVSNAIDVDKCVVWAKDRNGNIIARRLLALVPGGLLSYRTYSNRQSLALNPFFKKFIREYAEHCGVTLANAGHPGPLLSDNWYDDGAVNIRCENFAERP